MNNRSRDLSASTGKPGPHVAETMKNFDKVYRDHRKKLFNYLMRMSGDYALSQDIMQESFTRLYQRYRHAAPQVSLVYTIARNALFDHFRKMKPAVELDETGVGSPLDGERHIMVRDRYRRTLAAMEQLAPDERDVLSLVVSTDFSYRKIADITRLSEGNVKVKVHRARMHLKQLLQEDDHEG
jgi:RNA polymerase sigma-70 factor (ECF subfamily)